MNSTIHSCGVMTGNRPSEQEIVRTISVHDMVRALQKVKSRGRAGIYNGRGVMCFGRRLNFFFFEGQALGLRRKTLDLVVTLAARGLEEHVRITLIFSRIISFMIFTVLLSHMYFFRRISDSQFMS